MSCGRAIHCGASPTGSAHPEAIARANNIPPPFIIRVGERLSIPGGRYHRVKSGETGIAIARAYGVSWSKVVDGNALEEPYVLRVGQKLLLPSARQVAAMSLEDRARAFTIDIGDLIRSEEHTSEIQSLMRISYAVFCLKKKIQSNK